MKFMSVAAVLVVSFVPLNASGAEDLDSCGKLASRFATERTKMTPSEVGSLKKCIDDFLKKITSFDPNDFRVGAPSAVMR